MVSGCWKADIASEQLSAEGNLILMPDWAQSPLCGRLEKGFLADFAPSLILTKYLLCITWHALRPTLVFPGQVSNRLGRFVFHLAGLGPCPAQQAMLVSLGSCRMRNWLHGVLTHAMPLGATVHFNNTLHPQLHCSGMKLCHMCACTYTSFHTLTVQCYVLRAYPFNLKGTRRKCAKFLHSGITVVPPPPV